ncbi:helix-turn-helix transcriptional regulator [Fibrella aestuarina]|uniref:helix-turn-helix transcriptional regulator n=1 Tax=Fibrella aestuarina TaxID=651143 RepID=UPI00130E7547|nr:helix-turn-helix transcriptional regulator [Fibrella aestuarina]
MNQTQRQRLYDLLGENVKKYRSKKGLTQEQLANEVALTRTSVVNIEQGRQHPPLYILFDIAKALEIELGTLLPPESSFLSTSLIDEESLKGVAEKDLPKLTSFVAAFRKSTGDHEQKAAETN